MTGSAESQGVEASAQLRPTSDLTIAGWFAYSDAELITGAPSIGGPGTPLPFGPKYSANVSMDQNFEITDSIGGFAGVDVSYVGARPDRFVVGAPRESLPDYTKLDLKIGATLRSWTLTLFANNVTDVRGPLQFQSTTNPTANVLRPREVGASLGVSF